MLAWFKEICLMCSCIFGFTYAVCPDVTAFTSKTVIATIYDNHTKGDLIYTYPAILNSSLTFEGNCPGLYIQGNEIRLGLTNVQLIEKCGEPSGECKILCGKSVSKESSLKESLFPKRENLNQNGPTFAKKIYRVDVTENKLNGSVVFSFKDDDIKRHDCYYPDDKVFILKNYGKQIFGITYPGKIFLTKQLDYEDGDRSFDLHITLDVRYNIYLKS
ncbi:uncharacterized protein LOC134688047 [Mytilus trossulus]|uniref:uncharacterized protein LOC134688047 n=1 Tax=Mytilus trossulus TaxID=6551 RepID=UPI003006FAF2